jgi:hypothetical protein
VELQRRNRRAWGAIVERLRRGLGKSAMNDEAAAELDRDFSNGAIERRAQSPQGRHAMFREAGAMMEMADYAERNGDAESAPVVASLRSHAVAIRTRTVKSFLRFK